MAIHEIPLTAESQTFGIPLAGTTYRLTVVWRDPAPGWVLDIADASGAPLVQGIPLVTGADLLEQYRYAGFGCALYVQTDSNPDAVPTISNLGDASHLYLVTP